MTQRKAPLSANSSAKLLLAAGVVDLLLVLAATQILAPRVLEEIRFDPPEVVYVGIFVALMVIYWIITELLLSGTSLGRAALDLHLRDKTGKRLRWAPRLSRAMFKIMTFGLVGLNPNASSPYDRACGATWYCSMAPPPRKPLSEAVLVVRSGAHKGLRVPLARGRSFQATGKFTIGRDANWADLPLTKEAQVSARHCFVGIRDGRLYVRDAGKSRAGSTHGLTVRGKRITGGKGAMLNDERLFKVADIVIEIER